MPPQKFLIIIAITVVVIIVGSVGIILINQINPLTPQTLPPEQIRDQIINHIRISHPETASLMSNLDWTGGRQDTGLVGGEIYIYSTHNGWTVTIPYPVVPNPIYSVNATYASANMSVDWYGTIESNGIITETSYTHTP
jgi:hypothetical protein